MVSSLLGQSQALPIRKGNFGCAKFVLPHNQICKAMPEVPSSDLVNLYSISSSSVVLPSLKDIHLSSSQWRPHLPPVQSTDFKSPYFYLIVGRQPLIGPCSFFYSSSNKITSACSFHSIVQCDSRNSKSIFAQCSVDTDEHFAADEGL